LKRLPWLAFGGSTNRPDAKGKAVLRSVRCANAAALIGNRSLQSPTGDPLMNYEQRDAYGMYKSTPVKGPGPNPSHGPGPHLMGAATLIGNSVLNKEDVDLGDIKEIMLDMRNGRVSYAVLAFGGFFGMGEKLFAVPWEALKLDTENKRFVLDIAKDRLETAPGFDKSQWPNMADSTWAKGVHDYYGTKPYTDFTRN